MIIQKSKIHLSNVSVTVSLRHPLGLRFATVFNTYSPLICVEFTRLWTWKLLISGEKMREELTRWRQIGPGAYNGQRAKECPDQQAHSCPPPFCLYPPVGLLGLSSPALHTLWCVIEVRMGMDRRPCHWSFVLGEMLVSEQAPTSIRTMSPTRSTRIEDVRLSFLVWLLVAHSIGWRMTLSWNSGALMSDAFGLRLQLSCVFWEIICSYMHSCVVTV
jgi:hypothetical protein